MNAYDADRSTNARGVVVIQGCDAGADPEQGIDGLKATPARSVGELRVVVLASVPATR